MRQEKWYGMKRLLAEFPKKHRPLTTVKCLQRKIDNIGTVNRQFGSGRKLKVVIKQKMQCNFSKVLLIVCVKYFYNW